MWESNVFTKVCQSVHWGEGRVFLVPCSFWEVEGRVSLGLEYLKGYGTLEVGYIGVGCPGGTRVSRVALLAFWGGLVSREILK